MKKAMRRMTALVLALLTFVTMLPASVIAESTSESANPGAAIACFNVIINYLWPADNSIAASPWCAVIADGDSLNRTIAHPVIEGYEAYTLDANNNPVVSTELVINIEKISDHVTYNVYYRPAMVNYTINYYQQNITDDKYTLAESVTKQALTESTIPNSVVEEVTYDGFVRLPYEENLEVAADGSTVLEVYFDRLSYLMSFVLGDDAYGTEPIYARYGAELGTIPDPTRPGYTFKGWSLSATSSETVTLPTTMPAHNTTYYAVWEAVETAPVTVVFWGENADDEGYSYLSPSQVINVAPGTVLGYDGNNITTCGYHDHNADCYQLTCTIVPHNHSGCGLNCTHSHTLDCYSGEYGGSLSKMTSKPTQTLTHIGNGIYSYNNYGTTSYCLNIGNDWYQNGYGARHGITFNCSHVHSDSCYTCGIAANSHVHSEYTGSCYTLVCTNTNTHTHTSDCYIDINGLDSNLWTFVKSETVTVRADGSSIINVYFDRTIKTLTFNYNYDNGYKSTETIAAKWGADIADEYVAIADNAGSTFWSASTGGGGPYTNYFGRMPQNSATYYNRGASGSDGTMDYYGESLTGEYVLMFSVGGVGGYHVTDEDRYEFEGFTYDHGSDNNTDCEDAEFYYTRNSYDLVFNNGVEDVKTELVKFEAPLSNYSDFVPAAPSIYEAGSVVFAGWYLNPECTGEEFKLDEHIMPADDILLYAKWVPVTHTVSFYLDRTQYDTNNKLSTHSDITVLHGDRADDPVPATPENGEYVFVGWFYEEDGVEKAFDFANMPVNQDMNVYAKWSSSVLKEYTIYYKLQGTDTEIADKTTGAALAGNSKTFDAKVGDDLFDAYQAGYFPTEQSHTLVLNIDGNEENKLNEYTFWYVQRDKVPYIVNYVDTEGNVRHTQKVVADNKNAIVTEIYEPINGYLPDKYQQQLILNGDTSDGIEWITTADGVQVHPDNVITFVYTKDDLHKYYTATYYIEVSDGVYKEYVSNSYIGDIGTKYKFYADDNDPNAITPIDIPGYVFDEDNENNLLEGTLKPDEELHLKRYYNRLTCFYTVKYLDKDTNERVVPNDRTGNAKFGEQVIENAVDVDNYDLVSPETQTITMTEGDNVIIFYYVKAQRTVKITKDVTGNVGDRNRDFTFVVWNADDDTYALKSGVLSDDDTMEVAVDCGTTIVIKEANKSGYETTATVDGVDVDSVTGSDKNSDEASFTLKVEQSHTKDYIVVVTNDKNITVDTGILLDSAPYVLLLALVGAGIAFMIIRRRRRED